ncbi:uncharacterized protein LOC100905724 [Galendromus occidentalis]|uniref:Uncharacterized protein LOC100905724 n=1 Tax=Galendromus occidentalis TaxID=34638 RepID=A0AAJ6VY44_9ACAR|nr:uncharacterized protein LOC100905724 [Galendromus occidentalis]
MSGFEGRVMEVFWDGFDKSVRAELDWFWRDQRTLTDVTVCCENGSVRAHKLVLALSSSYFHNMCVQSQSACANSVISLPDVKIEDFKLILEYMYRGKVFINEMSAERLIKLARVLHIKGFGSQNRPQKERQRSGSESSQYVDSDDNESQKPKRPKVHIRPEEIAMDNVAPNRVTRATASSQALTSGHGHRNGRAQTPNSRRVVGPRSRKLSEPAGSNSLKSSHDRIPIGPIFADTPERAGIQDATISDQPGPSGARILSKPRSDTPETHEKQCVRTPNGLEKQGRSPSMQVEKAGPSCAKIPRLRDANESPENQDPTGSREKRSLIRRRSSVSPSKNLTKNVTLASVQSSDSRSTPNISAALTKLVMTNENETHRDSGLPSSRYSLSENCNECDFTASSAVELATHKIQVHTKPRPVAKTQSRKRQINSPIEDEIRDASKDDQLYVCDLCGFTSKNRGALGSHRNRHKSEVDTTSPKNLPLNLRANSEHFKPVYDCPKCINISFKTLNVMSRHFARRHLDENLQYITRIACSHCVHSYSQNDGSTEYKKHLKEVHDIEANFENTEKPSSDLARGATVSRKSSLLGNGAINEVSPILTNGEAGPSGVNNSDVPAGGNDLLAETASNADTERASSRGSFVVSLNEISAKAQAATLDVERCRLSNDDEATIDADLPKVKSEFTRNTSSTVVFHKCTDCNYQTSQLHFLRRHAIACHSNGTNEDPFLCRFCNFATAHRSTIKSHLVSVHRDSSTKISECYRNSEQIREFFEKNATPAKKLQQPVKTVRMRLTKSAPVAPPVSSLKSESSTNHNKESVIKKPAKKQGRPSQQFGAALKLKKAALAKQRSQSFTTLDSKAAQLSRTRASPRRPSSRQSAAEAPSDKRRSSSRNPTNLKCPDCTYEAKSYQMFTKHSVLHQDVDEAKLALCEVCGVVKLKSSMFYHLKKHQVDPPKTATRLSQ